MRRIANKFVIPCSALAVLLSPLAAANTIVSRGYGVASQTVNFADLDLTNSKGVATLYRRIRFAADKVCDSDEPTSLSTHMHVRICAKEAIDRAVKDVNSHALTNLHVAVAGHMDFQ